MNHSKETIYQHLTFNMFDQKYRLTSYRVMVLEELPDHF